MATSNIQRKLPQVIIIVVALTMIIQAFWVNPGFNFTAVELQKMLVPIGGFAGIVSTISLLIRNITLVKRRGREWYFPLVMTIMWVFFFVITILGRSLPKAGGGTQFTGLYSLVYINIIGKINEAFFSLIAVFMASMAYRSFKMQNLESALFGISCVLVLLGNAPISEVLMPGGDAIRNWIMDVPNMAGMRAVTIGVGLGVIAYGVRTMIGVERTAFGEFAFKKEASEE